MEAGRLSRREFVAAGAAAAVGVGLQGALASSARAAHRSTLDFATLPAGKGWPGWACTGVANLRRGAGEGVLAAGSDVFPCDPRPVAFAVDQRFRDGEITATVQSAGAGAGVVARRAGPRDYYAAIYDSELAALILVRRSLAGAEELARAAALGIRAPFELAVSVTGRDPTSLTATLRDAAGQTVHLSAADATPALQRAGDPGVLATARTLFPSAGPPVLPALGNLHLLPYGVQEGEAVMQTAVGEAALAQIRERSTATFAAISIEASDGPEPSAASVVAATGGAPLDGGALLRVATDVPARVEVEVSADPAFRSSRLLDVQTTNSQQGVFVTADGLPPGRRTYWRARTRRRGRTTLGPVKSFRTLPSASAPGAATIAIGACASQFGGIFERIADARPDVFIWQGDLNYPDTIGPLAQTVPAYAGIWRDFLANPKLTPLLERTLFAVQRDDHDYGVQDANSTNLVPWGLGPWERLMEPRTGYRFSAGVADFWVLDERRHKTDPEQPDTRAKTLLGERQRRWLLLTLAESTAPFKVVCSPCTLAPLPANGRDGSWAVGFTAERDLLLSHIRRNVSGRTIFVTGDTHWTMVYDRDDLFEARPCPLGIPTPNDITLTQPQVAEDARDVPGVAYADDEKGHFALLELGVREGRATLDLSLVREDGAVPFERRFQK